MKLNKYSYIAALPLIMATTAQATDIEISGAIEVEAGFSSDFNKVDTSDITLATVELGVDSQINDRVSGHLLLLHEEDDTPLEVDEGTISLDLTKGWSLTAGQMYVPFGVYESNMISDPLTLEMGETRESAVLIGYQTNGLYASAYVFNGDTSKASTPAGEDTIEHGGLSIGYLHETDNYSLDVGIDYINSLGDSDGLSTGLDGDSDGTPDPLTSFVSGTAFHWIYNRDALSFIVEHVKSDSFQAAELAFKGLGSTPSATNIEFGYGFDWGTAAIGYQTTDEAFALGLPETRILFYISHEIFENTSLGYEHAMDDDYSVADGGTGGDASTSTIQLAISF